VLVVRIWNFLRGYVIIRVEGINLERFINLSIANGIYFWDIERLNYTGIQAKVSLKGYKLLRRIKKRVSCRVSIVDKKGCPFLLHRIMKRKVLAAGGLAAILTMYLLTSFIWVVEVDGNEKVSENRIIRELENLGLKPGVFKHSLDIKKIETGLLIEMDQIAWVAVNIVGTKAVVDVVERVEPPPLVDKETPCNIIAKRDGIINNIFVFEGEPMVRVGDTVRAGQLLISGVVEKPGIPFQMVHAMGKVEARTWYQAEEVQCLKKQERERTGETDRKIKLKIGGIYIKLSPGEVNFDEYDKIEETKRLVEWRNIILPVELVIEKYFEVKVAEEILSLEEAKKLAIENIEQRLGETIPEGVKIVDRNVKYYEEDGEKIRVEVVLEALEDIGIEEKIDTGRTEY
jgi:similar to stage IV sporulation protein